jgi:hypothetical protein
MEDNHYDPVKETKWEYDRAIESEASDEMAMLLEC